MVIIKTEDYEMGNMLHRCVNDQQCRQGFPGAVWLNPPPCEGAPCSSFTILPGNVGLLRVSCRIGEEIQPAIHAMEEAVNSLDAVVFYLCSQDGDRQWLEYFEQRVLQTMLADIPRVAVIDRAAPALLPAVVSCDEIYATPGGMIRAHGAYPVITVFDDSDDPNEREQARTILAEREAEIKQITATIAGYRGNIELVRDFFLRIRISPKEMLVAGLIDGIATMEEVAARLAGKDTATGISVPVSAGQCPEENTNTTRCRNPDCRFFGKCRFSNPKADEERRSADDPHSSFRLSDNGIGILRLYDSIDESIKHPIEHLTENIPKIRLLLVLVHCYGSNHKWGERLEVAILRARQQGVRTLGWIDRAFSGGFLPACCCEQVMIAPDGEAGRFGSMLYHCYAGITPHRVVSSASPYKYSTEPINPPIDFWEQPLSDEKLQKSQRVVDENHAEHMRIVAGYRGKTIEEIRTYFDGRIFNADEMLAAGLVDGIMDLQSLVEKTTNPAK